MKKGIVSLLLIITGATVGAVINGKVLEKIIKKQKEKTSKFKSYYNMLNKWLMLKQCGKSLEEYFINHEYKSIAIYGMGEMGNRLYEDLKDSSINVRYAVDKNAETIFSGLKIYDLDEQETLEKVDIVVVTAIFAFNQIERELAEKIDSNIISLEDIVCEL